MLISLLVQIFKENYQLASASNGIWTSSSLRFAKRESRDAFGKHQHHPPWRVPKMVIPRAQLIHCKPIRKGCFFSATKSSMLEEICLMLCFLLDTFFAQKITKVLLQSIQYKALEQTNRLLVRYKPSIRTKTNGFYKPFQTLQHNPIPKRWKNMIFSIP